jgi:hypothetical protein
MPVFVGAAPDIDRSLEFSVNSSSRGGNKRRLRVVLTHGQSQRCMLLAVSGSESIACTLSASGQADQATRWRELLEQAGIARESTTSGVRLTFKDEPAVERLLRELVGVEAECCRWATWHVSHDRASLVLNVASTGDGVGALHAMFGLLVETLPAGQAPLGAE